jgi:hypothetical protein
MHKSVPEFHEVAGVLPFSHSRLRLFITQQGKPPVFVTGIARFLFLKVLQEQLAGFRERFSSVDAAKAYPDLFPSPEAAKKALQRAVPISGTFPYEYYPIGNVPEIPLLKSPTGRLGEASKPAARWLHSGACQSSKPGSNSSAARWRCSISPSLQRPALNRHPRRQRPSNHPPRPQTLPRPRQDQMALFPRSSPAVMAMRSRPMRSSSRTGCQRPCPNFGTSTCPMPLPSSAATAPIAGCRHAAMDRIINFLGLSQLHRNDLRARLTDVGDERAPFVLCGDDASGGFFCPWNFVSGRPKVRGAFHGCSEDSAPCPAPVQIA